MRAFYLAYAEGLTNLAQPVRGFAEAILPQPVAELKSTTTTILPQLVAELPWGHNILLLEKLKDPYERLWCAQATIQNGWWRVVLAAQIESACVAVRVAR